MTPEGRVKSKIKRWLAKFLSTTFVFMPRQSGFGVNGIPDYVCCVPMKVTKDMVGKTVGLFVGIEAKTAVGEQTDLQVLCENDIVKAHGIYLLVYGSDNVVDALSSLRKL